MNSWKKVYKCLFHVQSHIQFQRRVSIQSYIHWRVFVEQVKMISIVPAHRRALSVINTRTLSMYSPNIKERGDL